MKKLNALLAAIASPLQSLVLLAIRLYWGWSFFQTGKGKLMNLDRITHYFATLPFVSMAPRLNAIVAGSTECFGGLLLLVGLCSRLVSLPLMATLVVAYLTTETEALHVLFSNPDKFTGADPFLFLFAALLIFVFGPGKISVDAWLARRSASE
jgi:putative oxidoreductase